jgi:hypothetical protein
MKKRIGIVRPVVLAVVTLAANACESAPRDAVAPRTAWVYHEGRFRWPGDYSASAQADYNDRSGAPAGSRDIKVSVTGKWGLFQPFAPNYDFDTHPYRYLTFAMKPTVPDQVMTVYFELTGDVPVGKAVRLDAYGPAPRVGEWGTYRIPLADMGVASLHVYKFAIQDQTGREANVFYLDDVGFVADTAPAAP